ncbi:hypothetical protein B0H14DRAFT_2607664 [Mycena olivaceomarginata]|nr:hypothetical protein B0H14DRAFT_2607664 [Mycena olivaceomarginata]
MSNDIHKCIYKCVDKKAWTPAHAEHTGHASVTLLRAISEYEETQSFILALAIISGTRCLATEGGKRILKPVEAGIPQVEMVYKACSLSHISLIPSRKLALDYWSRCNLATCPDFMYPGSGGFSQVVRNLSNGVLDYWNECNLASCIEFMYPGSAGLIPTPGAKSSSEALDYCRRHFGNKDEEFAGGLFMV